MASQVPHSTTVSGKTITIWGDSDLVDQFFSLEPDAAVGPVNVQADFPNMTRRRYPGDPAPVNVDAHSATYSKQKAAKQNTTPGRAFTVETYSGAGFTKLESSYQFTLQGSFARLRTLADGSFAAGTFLRSPNGKLYRPVAAP